MHPSKPSQEDPPPSTNSRLRRQAQRPLPDPKALDRLIEGLLHNLTSFQTTIALHAHDPTAVRATVRSHIDSLNLVVDELTGIIRQTEGTG